jgi:hypothetical protein
MATSTRKNTRNALAESMRAESATFKARLERADALLSPAEAPRQTEVKAPKLRVPEVVEKPLAEKVVREAFTIPEAEHARLDGSRDRLLRHAVAVNKSEVVRAGLLALSEMDDKALLALFERLERVKTGRPKTV